MNPVTVILLLFALTTAFSLAAVRLKVPYPTAMVVAGLVIGGLVYLVPWLEGLSIRLDPEVLFTAILPPLLYGAAWNMSWKGFRANLWPILMLAIGAVIFTTVGIAGLAMLLLPGFTWPVAFALGAIVSPPDAVAATSVTERLRVPKRLSAILEGESLVNDASALVVYRFAVAAAMGAGVSFWGAAAQFPMVAAGGIVVGMVVAWLLRQVHARIEQPLIETAMTLLAPYAAYLAAEHFHLSGVLAVVVCGLIMSRHSPHLFSPSTRLTAVAMWNVLTFLLNGLVCILIGLQLPTILKSLHTSWGEAMLYGAIFCAALVVLRVVWVFPGMYVPFLWKSVRKREKLPPPREVFFVGWVGMRGVVSLAAALALPERLADGSPLPGRDLVLFLTFAAILATLVCQSVTLGWVIRKLKLELPAEDGCEEMEARRRALQAALDTLAAGPSTMVTRTVGGVYEHRMERLRDCRDSAELVDPEVALFRKTIGAQRKTLLGLRDEGKITHELWRKLERELDLEESRMG